MTQWRVAAVAVVLGGGGCGDDVATPVGGSGSPDTDATTIGTSSTAGPDSTTSVGSASTSTTAATGSSTDAADSSDASSATGRASSSGSGTDTGTSTGTSAAGSTDTGSGSETSGSESGGELVSACVDIDLGSTLGVTLGTTSPLADDGDPPCIPGVGGRDAGHRFVAPADGFYVFETANSAFDTVVYAMTPSCGDTPIGCQDDVGLADTTSRLQAFVADGQETVVVVDGWDDTQFGPYTLTVDGFFEPCVGEDLGSGAAMTTGTTVGQPDRLAPPCALAGAPDWIVRWTAPDDGGWIVSTFGSSFDTVLYVYEGECTGVPIACNDDESVVVLTSELLVTPGMGNTITVVVDGYGPTAQGDYVLSFSPL